MLRPSSRRRPAIGLPPAATGTTALVTGATGGIGYATAAALAAAGAAVVITGRDPDRGVRAQRLLNEQSGSSRVRFLAADHSTVDGNLSLTRAIRADVPRLDLLVNNVGGLVTTRQTSADGLELTLALNLRAAVLLTTALRPALTPPDGDATRAGTRVVNVGSDAYSMFRGDPFADVLSTSAYQAFDAYARAKLLLLLSSLALARELAPAGVTLNVVNPGMAWTPNVQAMTRDAVPAWRFVWPAVRWAQRRRPPEAAAAVVARLALQPIPAAAGSYTTSGGRTRALDRAVAGNRAAQQRALRLALDLSRGTP